ncbi:PD40 domain-containing protein [candidate division KSB1 bacterium]|nr:PD40 domain-containing protein [candidate division KSB1 bacterium]
MRIFTLLFILLTLAISANAQISIGYNHPELKWRVRQTEHFQIVYHQGTEALAEAAAGIAEEVFSPITSDLGVELRGRTTIIISDFDDISNGMAYPLGHYIYIWAKPFKKYTTGSMRWLRRVIAHEFAHIVTFKALRNAFGTPWELIGLGLMPTWFIEGVAQYEAERWDDHREMLLRISNSDGSLLSRAKMEGYIGADQIDSRLVYEQGHSLVRFLVAKFGHDKIARILETHRKLPISFNWSVKRAIGISENTLFKQWFDEISPQLKNAFDSCEQIEQIGTRFNSSLQANYSIRWAPDGNKAAVVGIESFEEQVARLYLMDRQSSKLKRIAGPFIGSHFSWAPDSRNLVYAKSRRARHFSRIDDLFIFDTETGEEQNLTYHLRATDPAWSPDGKDIVFCVHQGAVSNLALIELQSRNIRLLTEFNAWHEVYSPCWSPDGERIAFSLIDSSGKRDIALIRRDGNGFKKLTNDFTDDRTPCWSPDGTRLAFVSYLLQKPDLFTMKAECTGAVRITNIAGGVFNPTWSSGSDSIFVVAFDSRKKIDLFAISAKHRPVESTTPIAGDITSSKTDWRNALPPHPLPVSYPANTRLKAAAKPEPPEAARYPSLRNIRPQLTIPNLGFDDSGIQFGIYNIAADPLEKHSIIWSVTHRKRTHYFLDYTNTQFLPEITLFVSRYTYDRGYFLSRQLWESVRSFYAEISVPINFGRSLLSNHRIGLTFNSLSFKNLYSWNFTDLPQQTLPFEGSINSVGLNYSYSVIRPSIYYDIHPGDGFIFYSSIQKSASTLQSDLEYTQSLATATIRYHTFKSQHIALRTGLFFHIGDQRLQSRYALGTSMIRGLESSVEGDQILFTNLEYRVCVFRDIGIKIWFCYLEGIYGAAFVDAGLVWGSYLARVHHTNRLLWLKNEFAERQFRATGGAECRSRIYFAGKFALVLRAGLAWRLDKFSPTYNPYFLMGPVF